MIPIRRIAPLLADLLKARGSPSSARVLGKRDRRQTDPGSPPTSSAGQLAPGGLGTQIALQNEDVSKDAIVISVLADRPFCCHEDLLTMRRPQLVAVAVELNAVLPRALQIDLGPARGEAYIRNAIEVLVGLRARDARAVLRPPKRHARTRSLDLGVLARTRSAPAPPRTPPNPHADMKRRRTALQGRAIAMYTPAVRPGERARLEILEEDSEGEDGAGEDARQARPQKKRRDVDEGNRVRMRESETSPTPAARAPRPRHRRSVSQPAPILSQPEDVKGDVESDGMQVDVSFVDSASYARVRPKERLGHTSTPKKRQVPSAVPRVHGRHVREPAFSQPWGCSLSLRGDADGCDGFRGLDEEESSTATRLSFGLDMDISPRGS